MTSGEIFSNLGEVENNIKNGIGLIIPHNQPFDRIHFTNSVDGLTTRLYLYPKTLNNEELEKLILITGNFNIVTQLYLRGEKGYQIIINNPDWKRIKTVEMNSDSIDAFHETSKGWTIDYKKVTTNELNFVIDNAR